KNNHGAGVLNAIKRGFESVDDGVILVSMADLSDDYSKVDEMFRKVNEGHDIVCGSRYIRGGKQIGGPWFKKLLSRIAGVSLYYLIGIPTHDVTNSFKMYTKKVLNDITIESNGGFELSMEIVLKAFVKGYKITEVPSVWRDRSAGGSRFRLCKWLPKYLHWYWFGIKKRFLRRSCLSVSK
ncbi:MAG: glycosyltransferase, partial [Planctomycetota bacterium]